jgi:hypothetical protein
MSDTTSSDDTSDPTGTPHLGTDSDPLDSGDGLPTAAEPASTLPMQADGGRPDGDPAALTSDRSASTDVTGGTPQSVVPPTENSDSPRT